MLRAVQTVHTISWNLWGFYVSEHYFCLWYCVAKTYTAKPILL